MADYLDGHLKILVTAMFTHSFSASNFFNQPAFRNFDTDHHHHSHEKKGDDDKHHKIDKRADQDRFHPSSKHSNFATHKHHHRQESDDSLQNTRQNRLAEDYYQPSQPTESKKPETVNSIMAVQSEATNISKSADIKIVTEEGDVVTIKFDQVKSSSQSNFYMQQGDNSLSIYSDKHSYQAGFELSIEGDINEDEKEALQKLMKKMDKVSKQFFKGNVEQAFKHAQKIGFDNDQIASFSLSLNMEKSVEAVAAYQQTVMPEQDVDTDMLMQAGEFIAETKEFLADTKATLASLEEPKQSFNDMFASVAQFQNTPPVNENEQDEGKLLFLKMIENLTDSILTEKA